MNTTTKLTNVEAVAEHLMEATTATIAVRAANGEALLIWDHEDGPCYQGIPYEEDELGVSINHHSGNVDDLGAESWPMSAFAEAGN